MDMFKLARNIMYGYTRNSPCCFPEPAGAPKEKVSRASATASAVVIVPCKEDTELSTMWFALGNSMTTVFTPIHVPMTRYAAQSIELRNYTTNKEYRFRMLVSGEPYILSENIRALLFNETEGLIAKYPRIFNEVIDTWYKVEEYLVKFEELVRAVALKKVKADILKNETSKLIENIEA